MLIAIDYDQTYTLDPETWLAVIHVLQIKHEVICVTMRDALSENIGKYAPPCTIYYTDRIAKKRYLEKFGIKVDVWIDDRPDFIINDSLPRRLTTFTSASS